MRLFDKDKKPSIFQRIQWKLNKIQTSIRNIPNNLIMLAQWIPVLWNNWDWDYNFLLMILQYKLKRMEKHIREHDRHTNSQKYARQIQICVDIITRLQEDDYTKELDAAHEEKWGVVIYDFIPVVIDDPLASKYKGCSKLDIYTLKARQLGQEEQERSEKLALHAIAADRRRKDLNHLFGIMRKRLEHWWC